MRSANDGWPRRLQPEADVLADAPASDGGRRHLAPTPDVVDGPATAQDARAAYEVVESAFADHWSHHARSSRVVGPVEPPPGADAQLWWLAEVGGQPVGALIASRQMADEDAIYIATFATVRAARGRGVAKALLRRAFAAGWAEGWSRATLNVDAENTTAAPALYASVGLTVAFSGHAWLREVAWA